MTRIAMHALSRRFLRYVGPVLILLAVGRILFRDWGGTPSQLAFEFSVIAIICSIATEYAVLIFQKYRPWLPRSIFVWRRIMRGVAAGASLIFLGVFGDWLGRALAVGLVALFAFIWLRLPH